MLVAEIQQTVEVFKTNVPGASQARHILTVLRATFFSCKINFDLEDCDKILRVEGEDILPEDVIAVLSANGYWCEVLDD